MASLIGNVLMGIGALATVVVVIGAVSYAATGSFNPIDLFMNNPVPSDNTTNGNKTDTTPSPGIIVTPEPTATPTPAPTPTPTPIPPEEKYTITLTEGQKRHVSSGDYIEFIARVYKGNTSVHSIGVKLSTSDTSILYQYPDPKFNGIIATGYLPGTTDNYAGFGLWIGPNKGPVTVTATALLNGEVIAETSIQVIVT